MNNAIAMTLSLLTLFAKPCFAKTETSKQKNYSIKVLSVFGDSHSEFTVHNKNGLNTIRFKGPRAIIEQNLSEQDALAIKNAFINLASEPDLGPACSRTYVEAEAKGLLKTPINKTGCIVTVHRTTAEYTKFLRLLSSSLL